MAGYSVRLAGAGDIGPVDALLARAHPQLFKADYAPSVLVTALPLISRAQPGLLRSGSYLVAVAVAVAVAVGSAIISARVAGRRAAVRPGWAMSAIW